MDQYEQAVISCLTANGETFVAPQFDLGKGWSCPDFVAIDALQKDLDEWLHYYNNERTHQGKVCCGRTPMATLEDGKQIWQEKFIH